MTAIIISADDIKKTLPGYNPHKSGIHHRQSAQLADSAFEKALKNCSHSKVILMCGGSASGKTEYRTEYLDQEFPGIIFDGTLSSIQGAQTKLSKIRKSGKTAIINSIIPADLQLAFAAFLSRDRKYEPRHFYKTHSGSRKTLLFLALEYPKLKIEILENKHIKNKCDLDFSRLEFASRKELIDFLRGIQYTEEEVSLQVKL